MKARAFFVTCACTFAASVALFWLHARASGTRMDGSSVLAILFALAFVALALRVPEPGASCGRCGARADEKLGFCGRCGEALRS